MGKGMSFTKNSAFTETSFNTCWPYVDYIKKNRNNYADLGYDSFPRWIQKFDN